jgi:type II secretory pathway component PulF
MESGTCAAAELGRWKTRCAEGHAKFTDVAAGGKIFPPMFVWLVAGAGENLAAGFERAAQVYHARAAYRSNVLLYAALPASLLFLGLVMLAQMYPVARMIFQLPILLGR